MDQNPQNTPRPTGPSMDIQPPRPMQPQPMPASAQQNVAQTPLAVPPSSVPAPATPTAAPTPPPAPASPLPEDKKINPMAINGSAAAKSTAPKIAILVAVIVALGLTGMTIFAFMKTKDKPVATDTKQNTSESTQKAETKATPEDIDTTSSEIDATIKSIDDTKDFPSSDLSDATLGL